MKKKYFLIALAFYGAALLVRAMYPSDVIAATPGQSAGISVPALKTFYAYVADASATQTAMHVISPWSGKLKRYGVRAPGRDTLFSPINGVADDATECGITEKSSASFAIRNGGVTVTSFSYLPNYTAPDDVRIAAAIKSKPKLVTFCTSVSGTTITGCTNLTTNLTDNSSSTTSGDTLDSWPTTAYLFVCDDVPFSGVYFDMNTASTDADFNVAVSTYDAARSQHIEMACAASTGVCSDGTDGENHATNSESFGQDGYIGWRRDLAGPWTTLSIQGATSYYCAGFAPKNTDTDTAKKIGDVYTVPLAMTDAVAQVTLPTSEYTFSNATTSVTDASASTEMTITNLPIATVGGHMHSLLIGHHCQMKGAYFDVDGANSRVTGSVASLLNYAATPKFPDGTGATWTNFAYYVDSTQSASATLAADGFVIFDRSKISGGADEKLSWVPERFGSSDQLFFMRWSPTIHSLGKASGAAVTVDEIKIQLENKTWCYTEITDGANTTIKRPTRDLSVGVGDVLEINITDALEVCTGSAALELELIVEVTP